MMRSYGGREHVGAIGMAAVIGAWSRLAFAVGFYQVASEIRNQTVNLISFLFPPANDFGVKRIGGLQAAQIYRRGKARRKIDSDSVRPKGLSQRRDLAQIFG